MCEYEGECKDVFFFVNVGLWVFKVSVLCVLFVYVGVCIENSYWGVYGCFWVYILYIMYECVFLCRGLYF